MSENKSTAKSTESKSTTKAKSKGTKLTLDGRTVTVHNPTTVTNLKAQGWKVV